MRRIRLSRLFLVALLAAVAAFSTAPGDALAQGGAVENFTMTGNWTANCSFGTCDIQGNAAACEETEAEAELAAEIDVPPVLSCNGAYFTGTLRQTCSVVMPSGAGAAVCSDSGQVEFYLPDASDPGYTIGPIPVDVQGEDAGAAVGSNGAGAATLAFNAVDQYPWFVALDWGVVGELQECSALRVSCTPTFSVTITGVQVDG